MQSSVQGTLVILYIVNLREGYVVYKSRLPAEVRCTIFNSHSINISAGATRGTDEQPHAEKAHQDTAQAASYQQPSKQELATAK